jgi:hypothetical protein
MGRNNSPAQQAFEHPVPPNATELVWISILTPKVEKDETVGHSEPAQLNLFSLDTSNTNMRRTYMDDVHHTYW